MCIVIDLDVVCLVCLQPSKDMHLIFSTDEDDPELQFAQKISILSELKIDVNNGNLPRKICNKCMQDLKAAWRFRKHCQAAVTIFQTIVKLDDAHPQNTEAKESAEHQIKVPQGLQIRRININSSEVSEGGKSNDSFVLEKTDTEEEFIINNENVGSSFDELGTSNYEENKEADTLEFQIQEEADENDERNAEFTDDNAFVEYYITDCGTTDESTTKIYEEIYSGDNAEEEQPIINTEKQQRNRKSHTQKSNKPSTRSRPRRQSLMPKDVAKSSILVQTKSKGIIFIDNTNSSEDATQPEVREVKTRKRSAQSPEIKTPKICELCGNSYRYQHALNAHMRRHNNDKPFPCECCDKAFVSNVELRRHMRVHTGQKPYACQYCDRRFSDFGSRIKHERTHTGERPYHCTTCGKSFAYPHVLSVHVLTHTGEKRFRCEHCSKGFTKKAYLLSHINQHHGVPKVFRVVNDDTMDNSQSPAKPGNVEECVYTAKLVNEAISEVEEYDDDSFQKPDEIIITRSLMEPKMEVEDEGEDKPQEFTIRVR